MSGMAEGGMVGVVFGGREGIVGLSSSVDSAGSNGKCERASINSLHCSGLESRCCLQKKT